MKDEAPASLWSYGDAEPWRQGRAAIVWISLLVVIVQSGLVISSFVAGDVREVILRALAGCFACLLLFLTWIGQNWVRWIVAPFFAFYGFRSVVWGVVYERGALLLIGIGTLIVFAYLALSPAVYAFARRQRERAGLLEILGVGAGFLLVMASLASALLAFHMYKRSVEGDAVEFAQLTFRRVFVNRDAAFLETHSGKNRRHTTAVQFVARVEDQLGQCESAGPFAGSFTAKLDGRRLRLSGRVRTRAMFETGGAWVHIDVSGAEREWIV
ncbi:MAG TPA: hypothetical protein VK993_04125, partial [Chthoniobacterales bacterium]|nr:hypothetical protein [Chthoniobacterales bacterium]